MDTVAVLHSQCDSEANVQAAGGRPYTYFDPTHRVSSRGSAPEAITRAETRRMRCKLPTV